MSTTAAVNASNLTQTTEFDLNEVLGSKLSAILNQAHPSMDSNSNLDGVSGSNLPQFDSQLDLDALFSEIGATAGLPSSAPESVSGTIEVPDLTSTASSLPTSPHTPSKLNEHQPESQQQLEARQLPMNQSIGDAQSSHLNLDTELADVAQTSDSKKRKLEVSEGHSVLVNKGTLSQVKKKIRASHKLLSTYSALKVSFAHVCSQLSDTRTKLNAASTENERLHKEIEALRAQLSRQ